MFDIYPSKSLTPCYLLSMSKWLTDLLRLSRFCFFTVRSRHSDHHRNISVQKWPQVCTLNIVKLGETSWGRFFNMSINCWKVSYCYAYWTFFIQNYFLYMKSMNKIDIIQEEWLKHCTALCAWRCSRNVLVKPCSCLDFVVLSMYQTWKANFSK